MFYFYSGNHSNYTRILWFNIFMPKISSGGLFIFIKIMLWLAAKSPGTNTESDFYLFSLGMQNQLQWIFFQVVLFNKNIRLHDSTVNYDLNSLLQHLPWNQQNYAGKELGSSWCQVTQLWLWLHYGIPSTIRCFDGRQQTGSTGDSVHSALPSESKMTWCPGSAVCSLVFLLFLWDVNPSVLMKLLHITFWKGKLIFLLCFFLGNLISILLVLAACFYRVGRRD